MPAFSDTRADLLLMRVEAGHCHYEPWRWTSDGATIRLDLFIPRRYATAVAMRERRGLNTDGWCYQLPLASITQGTR